MEEVELVMAFGWYCPTCAEQNYSPALRVELTPDQMEEMDSLCPDEEEEDDSDSAYFCAPKVVCCARCNGSFSAIPPGLGEDEYEQKLEGEEEYD